MKRLLALLCLVASASAFAAPPSPASIEKLLTVTRAERMLDTTLKNLDGAMKRSMAQSLQGEKLSPEGKRITDSFATKSVAVMRDEMSWAKMKPLYVRLYSESFTQEEVDGLLAFYESPAGQAFVEKMPVVMQKSTLIMQERMSPIILRLQDAMKQAIAEAKAAK